MQATTPSPDADKSTWRQWFLARTQSIDPDLEASAKLREVLETFLGDRSGLNIASFAALPGEIDLLPLVHETSPQEWYFPKVVGDELTFHLVKDRDELKAGRFKIPEPSEALPTIAPSEFDIILCPGMGFGRDGSRLGRGRGYYDRTLAACTAHTRVIGIAHENQVVDSVPTEAHDRFMDGLLTPSGFAFLLE